MEQTRKSCTIHAHRPIHTLATHNIYPSDAAGISKLALRPIAGCCHLRTEWHDRNVHCTMYSYTYNGRLISYNLLHGAIVNDLEWLLTQISGARHYSRRWISQKQYKIDTQLKWNLHIPYWTMSFRMTLSDFSKILNHRERHAASLRQLSLL